MAGLEEIALALLAVTTNTSELAPYLIVMALGFLVGAWGQSARIPIAVIAGILLILIAVGGFMLENSTGDSGSRGFPGP